VSFVRLIVTQTHSASLHEQKRGDETMDNETKRNFEEMNRRLDFVEEALFKELLNREVPNKEGK